VGGGGGRREAPLGRRRGTRRPGRRRAGRGRCLGHLAVLRAQGRPQAGAPGRAGRPPGGRPDRRLRRQEALPMCFSAGATFAAGPPLLPAGLYCTRVAARGRPAYLPLALVPVVFSLQQFAEGFVWVGLAWGDDALVRAAALAFLA